MDELDPDGKYSRGLPQNHTQQDQEAFARYRIAVYRKRSSSWKNKLLKRYFKEDFEGFDQVMFRTLPLDVRRDLCSHLYSHGVYIPIHDEKISMPAALFKCKSEDLTWPEDELPQLQTPVHDVEHADEYHHEDLSGNSDAIRASRYGVGSMMKFYAYNTDKFSGALSDNFEKKLKLFNERSEQCCLTVQDKQKSFSLMLTGVALEYYFTHVKNIASDFNSIVSKIQERFVTEERTLMMTQEWDATSLKQYYKENSSNTKKECLDKMIARLQELQICLPKEYRSDIILKNKLLSACAGVEECRLARQKVAPTIEGVIADLHSSISTSTDSDAKPDNILNTNALLTALFTERKRFKRKPPRDKKAKKCFVCTKVGCWSTKHSAEERIAAYKKNKGLKAYIMDSLDSDEDEDNSPMDEKDADAYITELDTLIESLLEDNDFQETPQCNLTMAETEFVSELQDMATAHVLTKAVSKSKVKRYSRKQFYGIAVDTCCSYHSTGSYEQYLAYCSFVGCKPCIDTSKSIRVGFGMGNTKSRGVATCKIPMNALVLSIDIHVVDTDVPILLSLADMNKYQIYYDNTKDLLIHKKSGSTARVQLKFGHPFIVWNPQLNCLYTKAELTRLHRRFGHPQTEKLVNLLKRAEPEKLDINTRAMLDKIVKHCKLCQLHSQRPRRFKFTLRSEKHFNQVIYVDIVSIEKKHALHVVDEATRYQAARWIESDSADDVWRALRMCWIDVYIGPPDTVAHDAGKNFMARAFQQNAGLMKIDTKPIPVESSNSMTFVERYHAPLRKAYKIIRADIPSLSKEEVLQYAVKSLNDSVGPDGLIPTLLVYGALPRLGLPTDKPSPGTLDRAVAVRKASEQMSRYFAKRQLRDALRSRNGPDVSEIHNAPLGSKVLVYRTKNNSWEGPFTLLNIEGETCSVQCSDGPKTFRSTVVKLFKENNEKSPKVGMKIRVYWPADKKFYQGTISKFKENSNEYVIKYDDGDTETLDLSKETWEPSEMMNRNPTVYMVFKSGDVDFDDNLPENNPIEAFLREHDEGTVSQFKESRAKEIKGLMEKGVFVPVHKNAAEGYRIFGCRFVDTIKNEGSKEAFEKSRLVVQGFNDRNHGLLTHAPTVQRSSQRLLFSLSSILPSWSIYLRDISQAYTQSSTELNRKIFVKPVNELKLPNDMLLEIRRPLYGIPEAGLHWFNTYHAYHKNELDMKPSSHDLCLLYTKDGPSHDAREQPAGITCLQTDDSLFLANTKFKNLEEEKSGRFERKGVLKLDVGMPIKFNGTIATKLANRIQIRAAVSKRKLLNTIKVSPVNKSDYVSQRARGAYIASVCRPDLVYGFNAAAQHTEPDSSHARALNKLIKKCMESADVGLDYVSLDPGSIYIGVFIDASFANNCDYSSQLGFVTTLMDKKNNCNIIHFGSVKSKRVTRSALASELYAMVYGFDQSYVILRATQDFLGKKIPLRIYTDSLSLFDSLTNLNTTSEKRLLIDLSMLRESYERREIADVFWIPGDQNPADGLTKKSPCKALENLITTNKISITPSAWIERDEPSSITAEKYKRFLGQKPGY